MMNPLARNAVDARRGARDELGGREEGYVGRWDGRDIQEKINL